MGHTQRPAVFASGAEMTRREAAWLFAATIPLMGFKSCERQNTLALLTETLGNAVASLAQIAGNDQLANQLRQHTQTAVSLLRGWTPGMPPADIIRALNRIIEDLKLFPADSKYAALITFVLGTIASIIEQLHGASPATNVRITAPPKDAEDFKHYWDAIRAGSPDMHDAPIL